MTGFPEMLDGRVKTLHPAVHGGLLARRDRPDHLDALAAHGIGEIDLLVCNLYPFARDRGLGRRPRDLHREHRYRRPGPDPRRREEPRIRHRRHRPRGLRHRARRDREPAAGSALALRRSLARKAYALTAAYDAAISLWFARDEGVTFPETLVGAAALVAQTRYGENPHQRAALYRTGDTRPGVATARQIQGKELSYNNYADADAAYELVAEFAAPAVAIIKHANPCGAAIGASLREAWEKALACDPVSAFGGIVALNRPLDAATAEAIAKIFVEVIIAPEADPEARDILARKEALRLLVADGLPDPKAESWTTHELAGGLLIQERDRVTASRDDLRVVTKRAPTEAEIADLLFADTVAKHVKSNAIVFARGGATVGIGAGQMSRVDSVRIAAQKAAEAAANAGLSGAGDNAARSSRRTPSTRSPTGSKRRSGPAPPRRSSPAARAATPR